MKTNLFRRNSIRKVTAFLLAAVMMFPQNFAAFAEIAEIIPDASQGAEVFGAEAMTGSSGGESFGELFLPGERIASASDAAGDGSVIYFGSVEVSASEPGGILNIPVYREGHITEESSVTIRTLDMMAVYGEDYQILGENKAEYPGGISLMERAMTAEAGSEEDGAITYGVDPESGEAVRIASPSEIGEAVNAMDTATAKLVIDGTGKSRLALEKEAETGITAREPVETAAQNVSDAILSSIVPDILSDIVYSCEQKLYFAPGSNETMLRVEILDDDISEGMEMFTVIMVASDGSRIFTSNNSMSVVISDNEESEKSRISFSSDSYEGAGGVAEIQIIRQGSEHSLATAVLYGSNEETGVRKALGQVVFVPYQTQLEQKLSLEGLTSVELGDFEGAEEGSVIHADLIGSGADDGELLTDPLLGSDDLLGMDPDDGAGALSREVTIGGRKYTLRYNKNESVATIVDRSYSPELEVGRYFFCAPPQKGGMFRFWKSGTNPGWTGSWKSEYRVKSLSDAAQNYGYMHYYSAWPPDKGICGTYVSYKESQIEEPYYQVVFPEWEQASNKYWGHRSWFELREDTDQWGAFSSVLRTGKIERCFDTGAGARIINANGYNGSGKVALRAFIQDNNSHTPVMDMYFYGVAAMYKRYRISAVNPEPLKLKTGALDSAGNYITTEMEPAIASIKCGAQVIAGSQQERDMLINVDPDKSSTVVTLGTNTLYGKSHIYGKITGYQITIAPGANATTLKYPEDFLKYLQEGRSKKKKGTALSFDPKEIASVKAKVLNNLQTIPFDKYFADWIQSNQKRIYETGELSNKAYYQKLQLKPIFTTSDVKVEVVRPEGGLDAVFADQHLKVSAPGTSYTYHAGDRLDLTPAGYDTRFYEADGYDISVDGGLWRNIPDETYLLLEPGRAYKIRPAIRAKKNWIEVRPEGAAATGLTIANTVPQEKLKDYSELTGKFILDLHPEESNIYDRIRPEPGRYYEIAAKTEDDGSGVKQCIAYTDPETGEKYQSNIFYLKAERIPANNIVRVTRYAVRQEELAEYTVSGTVVLKTNALREDAQEHRTPVEGYSVFCPDSRGQAGDLTDDDGGFELKGILAAKGDRRQILFGTNLNRHDSQIVVVEFGEDRQIRKGMIELLYPHDAPKIASLTYSYANNKTADVSLNTFPVMDDSLILKAIVDESPSGHRAKEVVFTLHRADGRVDGSAFIFKAKPEKDGSNVFSVQIDKMLDVFRNGDYFTVHLVDTQTAKVIIEGKEQEIPILYPETWTGLTAYTENVYIEPKEMQFGLGNPEQMDLPVVGRVGGKLMSGPLGLSKTKWTKGNGYTITVNLEALLVGGGSLSTEQKLEEFEKFRSNGFKILSEKKEVAENEGKGKLISNTGSLFPDLISQKGDSKNMDELSHRTEDMVSKIAGADDEQSEVGADQKKKKWKFSVNVVVGLEFDFAHRPDAGDYFMVQWAIMAGGSLMASRTWPFMAGSVPMFLNFCGYGQANLVWGMVTDEAKESVKAGEFNAHTGNIKTLLNRDDNYMLDVDIIVKPTGSVGVGLNGVLSARGFITPHFHFQVLENIMPKGNGVGFAAGLAGGIAVDLVFTSVSITIAGVSGGCGSLEDETGVSFFNGLKAADAAEDQGEFVPRERNASVLSEGTQETISAEEYSYGTADMSDFADYGAGRFGDLPGETLLLDAADRTRPQMIELDDGRQLLLFIGKRQTAGDEACLYYTIRDPEGEWTEPKPVNDDGTFDSSPALVKTENNYIVAAWTDTTEKIDGQEDFRKKANAFGISAAVFYPATGTFGQKIALTDRKNFNILPRLCAFGDQVICTFLARDVDSMTSVLDLADLSSSYNAPKYTVFDAASETVDISEKTGSREHFIRAVSEDQEDPMVTDLAAETIKVGGKWYAVMTYTVDEDRDQTTFEDRKLYLKIDNLSDGLTHFPILVNRDTVMDAAPKLTKLNENLYLTWLSEGTKFSLLKVDDVLNVLDTAGVLSGGEDPAKLASKEQTEDRDWYRITPEKIISKGPEPEMTEAEVICTYLADNLLPYESLDLDDKEVAKGISEYELVTDGTDLYIFFGSQTGTDPEAADKAIYAFRYMTGGVEFGTFEDPETGEGDWEYRDFGFTLPAQMTDSGRAFDEFDVLMDEQKRISVISNAYRQRINEEGKLEYSRNDLVYLNGVPEGGVEIVPETASISHYLVGGEETNITFDVVNKGLLPVQGYHAEIRTKGSDSREIWSGDFAKTLDSGQTDTVLCTWTVPDDVSGTELEIMVEELGGSRGEPSTTYLGIPCEARIELSTPKIDLVDGRLSFRTTVSNRGNADADAFSVTLRDNSTAAIMNGEDMASAFASAEVPYLASGEEKEVELSFKVAPEHFNSWGSIQLRGSAERGEEVLGETYGSYNASVPMVAKILCNSEPKITKSTGALALGAQAAPWADIAGEPIFSSSDEGIAIVDATGRVRGVNNGKATITVSYPKWGLMDSIEVTVTDDPVEPHEAENAVPGGPAGAKQMIGRWQQTADGSWKFLTLSGSTFTGWGYISTADGWDYYHLRTDGIMDCGWYFDEKLKKWYYLNELHNGRFGAMTRGWHLDAKDGKWYYLDPKTGEMCVGWVQVSGKWYYLSPGSTVPAWIKNEKGEWVYSGTGRPCGSMYANEMTPDGYRVNEKGEWFVSGNGFH